MSTRKGVERPSSTGVLDPNFGENGSIEINSPDPNYPNYVPLAVAIDPNSNYIYTAGQALQGLNNSIYTLARLDKNGALDKNFAVDGYFIGRFLSSDETHFFCTSINFLNGKILLSGHVYHYKNGTMRQDKAAVCILPNGEIDKSFANDGEFVFNAAEDEKAPNRTAAYEEARLNEARRRYSERGELRTLNSTDSSTCTITDEHILLLHETGSFDESKSFIIRLNLQGQLDKTFDGTGFVSISHPIFPFLTLKSLIVSKEGSYISAGEVKVGYFDLPDAIVLVKHHADGRLDTAFQDKGFLLTPSPTPGQFFLLEKMVRQPGNHLLCMGRTVDQNTLETMPLLISRTADGFSNNQFNDGNPVMTPTGSFHSSFINTEFRPDESLLVAAVVEQKNSPSLHYSTTRFLRDGTHDKSYGDENGWLHFPQTQFLRWNALAIDNRTILVSIETKVDSVFNCAIARGLLP